VEQEVEKEEVYKKEEKEEEEKVSYEILRVNGLPARELVQLKRPRGLYPLKGGPLEAILY
jgi:hypothetical protein